MISVDLDGTIDTAPVFFTQLFHALPCIVVTGNADAREKLQNLGVTGYRDVVVLPEPHAHNKAEWLVENHAAALIDNDATNVQAAVAAGIPAALWFAPTTTSTTAGRSIRSGTFNGKPAKHVAVANKFRSALASAFAAKSAPRIATVLSSVYVASYLAGQSTVPAVPVLPIDTDPLTYTVDADTPPRLAGLLNDVEQYGQNLLGSIEDDTTTSDECVDTAAASGEVAGVADTADAAGMSVVVVCDDDACEKCRDVEGSDDPGVLPVHSSCGCTVRAVAEDERSLSYDVLLRQLEQTERARARHRAAVIRSLERAC